MASRKIIAALLASLSFSATATGAADLNFVMSPVSRPFFVPQVIDINGDGQLETLGILNNGAGKFLYQSPDAIGLGDLTIPDPGGWRPSDAKLADFNGDGCPDLITQGYSSALMDTRALLYFNDGTGRFLKDDAFANVNYGQGIRGRGEGVVVADFNNDGAVDIFLPYYTFSCASNGSDPMCPNSPQNYLFLNDGKGSFREVAALAGVDMSAPPGAQPEGVQAVDINQDGLVDLYVGGKLFLNEYIDSNGVPHFADCACGIAASVTGAAVDEGAKFLDFNNDGKLDLVFQRPNLGPLLYLNDGADPRHPHFAAQATATDGSGRPLFSTGAPNYSRVYFQNSWGLNIYDLDNDGLEDVVVPGSPIGNDPCLPGNPPTSAGNCNYPNVIFKNKGYGFEPVSAGQISGALGNTAVAFGDFDGDGKIDAAYSGIPGYIFLNKTVPDANSSSMWIEVVGPRGENNQYGRVVRVTPRQAAGNVTYTRVVDGGSGYHTQNQYPLLIGTRYSGPHKIEALFPAPTSGQAPVTVAFDMVPGQYARIIAPSVQFQSYWPIGRFELFNQRPAPLKFNCGDWQREAVDMLLRD